MNNQTEKHPASLRVFFATEMWERYGFYVVQTLLALYLANSFDWHDSEIYALVGSFTALTYISPLIGGWIADHLIGQRRAIFFGAYLLFASYSLLALLHTKLGLLICLSGIAVGTGLLKPNISSLLGNEYPNEAPNRERGFTIFYLGIQLGIILGTTLPSYIQEKLNWSAAFLSGAIGMLIALTVFHFGVRHFKIKDYNRVSVQYSHYLKTIVLLLSMWLGGFYVLNYPRFADMIFMTIIALCGAYLLKIMRHESPDQKRQTMVIALLCIISIMFWSFYFQMFMSLTLFVSRVVHPSLFGIPFYPPYFVGLQSIGMIVIGAFLGRNKKARSTVERGIEIGNYFLYSILLMALAYGTIYLICLVGFTNMQISPLLLFPTYLIISLSELLLSPVGLSAMTLLASRKRVSTIMGIFFVSLGFGGYLSGKFSNITALPNAQNLSLDSIHAHYLHAFGTLVTYLVFISIFCFILNQLIRHLLRKNIHLRS